MLTESGRSVGNDPVVVDFRGFVVLRETGFPLVFDAGPGPDAASPAARSERHAAGELAKTAVAVGVDGVALLVEDETRKRADGSTEGYSLAALRDLLDQLKGIEQKLKLT
jgi:2-dehydro-3-deoxyphosphooctonate aldolase (KDO 8-P synthase)